MTNVDYSSTSMYMYTVCMCLCIHVYMCRCMCRGLRLIWKSSWITLPVYLLRQGFFFNKILLLWLVLCASLFWDPVFLPSEARIIDGSPCMPTWNSVGSRDLKFQFYVTSLLSTQPSPQLFLNTF